jgi:hypothetical protein
MASVLSSGNQETSISAITTSMRGKVTEQCNGQMVVSSKAIGSKEYRKV